MGKNISLLIMLDANKLTGLNFLDWYHNMRIVLKQETMLYILDNLIFLPLIRMVIKKLGLNSNVILMMISVLHL
jgi:hypothetical protein